MIKLNIINYCNEYNFKKIFKHIEKTACKVLDYKEKTLLNVVICDDEMIHEYNLKYRNIDRPTDVLSFPSDEKGELGDILISFPTAIRQAKEYGHSTEREMGFLLIHGTLHCLGYDHIKKEDEEIMFPLQEQILEEVELRRD